MKAAYRGPAQALERYEALVASKRTVERKGASMPYTSCNGHMFSFLDSEGIIALRLSDENREEFEAVYGHSPVEQHGRIMRDYVRVPEQLHVSPEELTCWFERSWRWVNSLKPKPTTRARPAKIKGLSR